MNRRLLFPCLLTLLGICFPSYAAAHEEGRAMTLTLLRGTWEYHTFDDKWVLNFFSDSLLFVNNEPMRYGLLDDTLFLENAGGERAIPFRLQRDLLTIQYPGSTALTYHRSGEGAAEGDVVGTYVATIDSVRDVYIAIRGHQRCIEGVRVYQGGILDTIRASGMYRVERDDIVILSDDGRVEHCIVRERADDNNPVSVILNYVLYTRSPEVPDPGPIVEVYQPPFPPPHPPCWDCPPPQPPPPLPVPDLPAAPPANNHGSAPVEKTHSSRDFGSTRTGGTSDSQSTGARIGERKPR